MLVLTRRQGEEIIIGDDIRITVVSVKGDRVRIGIKAPTDVPVDRQEIHERRMAFATVPAAEPARGPVANGRADRPVCVDGETPAARPRPTKS